MNSKKTKSKNAAAQSSTDEQITVEQAVNAEAESVAAMPAPKDESVAGKKHQSRKIKVIRDSFSFPEQDYRKISELKKTCLAAGVHVKKSEILRAGLSLLSQLSLDALKQTVESVEKVQTGRPSQKNG